MDFNFDTSTISSVLELDPGTNNLAISGNRGLVLPVGTTANRAPAQGVLRFNTTLGAFEGFDGTVWGRLQIGSLSLNNFASLVGAGVLVQTSAGNYAVRTLTGTAGSIEIANSDGVSGNPTFALTTAGTAGTYAQVTTDTFGRVTSGSATQAWSTLTGTPTTLAGYAITDSVNNAGGVISLQAGVDSSKPAAGTAGRLYFSTDTRTLSYDTGAAWFVEAPALTGDITTIAGSTTTTLATVTANTGTFGSSSTVGVITVNAKGLITSATNTAITPASIGAVNTILVGVANGIATLDASGTVPTSQLPASILGAMIYQGVWNASTNSPTLVSSAGTKGHYYVVSVAGATTINGQSGWAIGDIIVYNGTKWDAIDGKPTEVTSVFGRVGAVTATLASSDFSNQGTSTSFLKGNAAGNPTWSNINLVTDVTGLLPAASLPAFTGDITKASGSTATVLATVNTNIGTFGSTSSVGAFTVNAKGLITAASSVTIPSAITITGDATGTGSTTTNTAVTLANVNSNVGVFGSASNIASFTVNTKGLITAASNIAVTSAAIGAIANAGGVPSIKAGVYASRTAAGVPGAVFISTDTREIFRDDGAVWSQISESALLFTENADSPTASVVSGNNAVSIGDGNTVTAANATAIGNGASATSYGVVVSANGKFSVAGDAQTGKYILRTATTNNTQTEVFLDGTAGTARITLPNLSTFVYSAMVTARSTTTLNNNGGWKIEGVVKRNATASTTALVGSRSKTTFTSPAGWGAEVYADTGSGSLTFKVTGDNSQSINWVISVTTNEVIG